jgi:uncharacterized membrane protein YcjF (UPF0283 family)
MLSKLWKIAVRVGLMIAAVLTFLVVLELLRAYQTIRGAHPRYGPIAGYVFAGAVILLVLWSIGRLMGGWRHRPKVLRPPKIGTLDEADVRGLRRHAKYLAKYLRRLSHNRALPQEKRAEAHTACVEFREAVRGCRRRRDQLRDLLKKTENERIEPLLAELDKQAEGEIEECVMHVMIGVAASPWDAVDLLLVLYRNGGMVTRITQCYNSRPALRERLSIFADTLRIVAMIKFASLSSSLLKKCTNVPLIGRTLQPLVQAVGAGVLTSAAGHAAVRRCRAFRPWNHEDAAQHLGNKVGQYLSDCWHAARDHILPILEKRLADVPAAAWGKIRKGFGSAVDATAEVAGDYVSKPVGRAAKATGGFFGRLFKRVDEFAGPVQAVAQPAAAAAPGAAAPPPAAPAPALADGAQPPAEPAPQPPPAAPAEAQPAPADEPPEQPPQAPSEQPPQAPAQQQQ